jgi:hypothetical protein
VFIAAKGRGGRKSSGHNSDQVYAKTAQQFVRSFGATRAVADGRRRRLLSSVCVCRDTPARVIITLVLRLRGGARDNMAWGMLEDQKEMRRHRRAGLQSQLEGTPVGYLD